MTATMRRQAIDYPELAGIAAEVIVRRLAIPEQLGTALQIGTYAARKHLLQLEKPWGIVGRVGNHVPRAVLIHPNHTEFVVRTIAKWRGAPPIRPPFARLSMPPLTAEQHDLIDMVATGLSNKQIATRLNVCDTTAKQHVHKLLLMFGAPNRQNLVHRCHLAGIFGDLPRKPGANHA